MRRIGHIQTGIEVAEGNLQRWRCDCAYDGTEFAGWQKQPSKLAIQDYIEHALEEIFHHPVKTIGAGRTDAGVHAKNQVFHFDKDWSHSEENLLQAMRSHLPKGISRGRSVKLSSRFHAHLSAKGKQYRYRALKGWAMPPGRTVRFISQEFTA